jgi:RNA polymerase sigma factor (sigma-70 family)
MELSSEWVEQARNGDRAAREALGVWCLRRAFRLAYVDLGGVPNREKLAEEIAGEASARALAALGQITSAAQFPAWFHQIVRNCARTQLCDDSDRAVPRFLYQRWVHDFLRTHEREMETLIRREMGEEASEPHPVVMQRIAADLSTRTYRQFLRLSYEGRADVVLSTVKQWLRSFVGLDWVSLYERNDAGEWMATEVRAEEETENQVLQHEFIQEVNERLAELQPLCRRMIRWYYLDRLRMQEIAALERMHERTAYRRLENCARSFKAQLMRDGYFAEFAEVQR